MSRTREQNRTDVVAAILASARRQVTESGTISMRAVAREVGMVSSAVFRYFPTREALLTRMVVESYEHLADALAAAVGSRAGSEAWLAAAHALRRWALAVPHEFQLIYGTPQPDYQAPPETIPVAQRVAETFQRACGLEQPTDHLVAELAQLVGMISLELGGHLVGVVQDREAFYLAAVQRQIDTLGLA